MSRWGTRFPGTPHVRAGLRAVRSARPPQVWTPAQQRVIVALMLVLLAALWMARWRDPVLVPDPPADGPRAAELATRLDPNTADAAALSALPGLGEAHARAIVDYRAAFAAHHGGRLPFRSPRDLLPIKGVGRSTVNNLEPYLAFPLADPR